MAFRWHQLAAALLLFAATNHSVRAQSEYPSKSVQIISDSAAGGAIDLTQRIIANKLSEIWGQQVVIVNRPGAGGGISAKAASQAWPDGYTLYSPGTSPFLVLQGAAAVSPNLPLELPRDFVPIGSMVEQPFIIGASHKSGITDVATLIKAAKEKPGEITYAATGRGRVTHLTMELLQARTGTKLQLVPFAGGTPQAMGDILSGRIPLVIDGFPGLAGAVKGDAIKGLAVTSSQRLPGYEDVPTVAETISGFAVGAFVVLVAPLGTPDPIVSKVNTDLRTALNDPIVKNRIAANGAFARYMKPEQLTEFVQDQQKTWLPIMERVEKEMQK